MLFSDTCHYAYSNNCFMLVAALIRIPSVLVLPVYRLGIEAIMAWLQILPAAA